MTTSLPTGKIQAPLPVTQQQNVAPNLNKRYRTTLIAVLRKHPERRLRGVPGRQLRKRLKTFRDLVGSSWSTISISLRRGICHLPTAGWDELMYQLRAARRQAKYAPRRRVVLRNYGIPRPRVRPIPAVPEQVTRPATVRYIVPPLDVPAFQLDTELPPRTLFAPSSGPSIRSFDHPEAEPPKWRFRPSEGQPQHPLRDRVVPADGIRDAVVVDRLASMTQGGEIFRRQRALALKTCYVCNIRYARTREVIACEISHGKDWP